MCSGTSHIQGLSSTESIHPRSWLHLCTQHPGRHWHAPRRRPAPAVPPPPFLFLLQGSPASTSALLGIMQASASRAAHSKPLQQQRQQQCPGRPAAPCLARRRAAAAVRAAASAAPDGQQPPQPAGLRITAGVELPSQGQASFPAGSPLFDLRIAKQAASWRHEQAVLLPAAGLGAAACLPRSQLVPLHLASLLPFSLLLQAVVEGVADTDYINRQLMEILAPKTDYLAVGAGPCGVQARW